MKGFMICYNNKNAEVNKISLIKMPLKESYIIQKSEELYNESEPCIIYRTAIINKTGLDLIKKIENTYPDKINIKIDLKDLKILIGDILNLSKDIKYIKFI